MATINELSKIFIALQNRAIDQSIVTQYSSQSVPEAIIAAIGNNNVAYTTNPRSFVETIYKNLLGKNPSDDVEGINYWVNKMTKSENNPTALTPAQVVEEIIKEVQRYDDAIAAGQATITIIDAEGKEVQKTISTVDVASLKVFGTKVQISTSTAEKVGEVDAFYLTFGAGLSEVTKDNAETIAETINKEVTSVAERYPASDPGISATLTTDNPNFNATNGATDKDDTVNALVDGTNSTLQASSNIDALGGNDTLKVQMKGDFSGLSASGSITNVENIELTNTTSQNLSFNAKGVTGVRTYTINGDTNGNSVNLQDVAYSNNLEVRLSGVKNTDGTTIGFDADNAPTNGSLSVRLNNVGTNTNSHNITFDGISNAQVYLAGGNNYANFTGNSLSTISVGGTGAFTTKLGEKVTSFNASNATGNITIDASLTQGATPAKLKSITTGDGKDNVTVDAARLERNSIIDLGGGEDTLKFTGSVTDTTRQYFDLASVESLVFNTTGTLSLDLGSSSIDDFGNTVATNNRSANLKSVTIENGASVDVRELGSKNLNITYNNGSGSTSTSLDHAGTTNLTFKAASGAASGDINLSETTSLSINVEGDGFNGRLSAAKATELNINNNTTNKAFILGASSATFVNDLKSVSALKVNTESQAANAYNVDLRAATFNTLSTVTLEGKGNVALGSISQSGGITITGTEFSGTLLAGDINVGQNTLSITTTGALITRALTGNNVVVDLSQSIGLNGVGSINLAGTQSSLTYSAGRGGTPSAEQIINITGQRSNITLNGTSEAADAFLVKAGSSTNTITLGGNLGSATRNSVTVDLGETTSDTRVDLGRLQGNNNVKVVTSQGKDAITLAKDGNTDTVIFEAAVSGSGTPTKETVTATAAGLKRGEGLTFGASDGEVHLHALQDVTANDVATTIAAILNERSIDETKFIQEGTYKAPYNADDWNITASGTGIVFTGKSFEDLPDISGGASGLAFKQNTITAATSVTDFAATNKVTTASGGTAGTALASAAVSGGAVSGAASAAITTTPAAGSASTKAGADQTYTVTIDPDGTATTHTIVMAAMGTSAPTATEVGSLLAAILEGDTSYTLSSKTLSKLTLDGTNILHTDGNKITSTNDLTGNDWKITSSSATVKWEMENANGNATAALPPKVSFGTIAASSGAVDAAAPTSAPTQGVFSVKATGLKTSATDTAKTVEVEIKTNFGGVTLNPEDVAKIVAEVLKGGNGSTLSTQLAKVASVTVREDGTGSGTNILSSGTLSGKNYVGTGWTVGTDGTNGQLTFTPQSSPNYGMDSTFAIQAKTAALGDGTGYTGTLAPTIQSPADATVTIAFKALSAGQSYTFDSKTVLAFTNLTDEQVSNAFTNPKPQDGFIKDAEGNKIAYVSGDFANLTTANGFSGTFNSTTKVTTWTTTQDIKVASGGANAVSTATGNTATSGTISPSYGAYTQGDYGRDIPSSSYVKAGTTLDESHLDSITNFEIGKDKISVDGVTPNIATSVGSVTINNGIANFGSNITDLNSKFKALATLAQNEAVGFVHNNDFYVVIGGRDATKVDVDDIAVKLVGVNNVSDLGNLLA